MATPDPMYKVTHQEQATGINAAGQRNKTWTVHLEHPGGVKSTVELDDEHYTAENVHAAAQLQGQTVADVAKLPDGAPEPSS